MTGCQNEFRLRLTEKEPCRSPLINLYDNQAGAPEAFFLKIL